MLKLRSRQSRNLSEAVCFENYRLLAQRRLPPVMLDYIDCGAWNEASQRRNTQDLDSITLRQRVLRDVPMITTGRSLFGIHLAMPLVLGPVGLAGMLAHRGEVQASLAASARGLPFSLSTVSLCGIDEVTSADRPPWFQLYMLKDCGYMRELLERVRSLNAPVLILTVDFPVFGRRLREQRKSIVGLSEAGTMIRYMSQGLGHPRWLLYVFARGRPHRLGNLVPALPDDPTVAWPDLDFVRSHWSGPILLKGLLDPDDAEAAVEAGMDSLIVSNHGGRQLDGVSSRISCLPTIVARIARRISVLFDGGIRFGLDVLKAVAAGADAWLIGKAWAFALAAGGQAEVERMLRQFEDDLRIGMMLTGARNLEELSNVISQEKRP